MKRVVRQIINPFILILSFLTIFTGCICESKEILRITSPDNRVDAVLEEINCHTTTPFVYRLYIVPKGASIQKSYLVFHADHLEDETIQWLAPKLLEIKYKYARIYKFTNHWLPKDDFNYVVEIIERSSSYPHALNPSDR